MRGDSANLVGIIGDRSTLASLERLLQDNNEDVRLIAKEAIEDITSQETV